MKSNIDDKCVEAFKELKFSKKNRYLIYKVDNEKVVTFALPRSSIRQVKEKKIGPTSSKHSRTKIQECASSILSTATRTG